MQLDRLRPNARDAANARAFNSGLTRMFSCAVKFFGFVIRAQYPDQNHHTDRAPDTDHGDGDLLLG